ncbi:unnamed protein product [Brassica oleracea var. botrytis]
MTKVRDGLLLGKKTILKSDYLPACQNKSVNPRIESAPNYHQARSLHVHGVAMPTAVGIRNLLDHIGAHKASNQVQVLWISLREEPVTQIYINGKSYVLRDLDNPFTNMGMKRLNVDQMEEDLRGDVLMEASRHGNKILVTDELPDGEMVDQWEPVVSNESLKTMLEVVYQELQAEGYLVEYARVPVTEPKDTDFDALIRKISQADINTEIIFSCQI